MKVLNLRCANGHGFEGWFASDDAFMAQNGSAQIACPLCADTLISRMPSAPRLNLSGARAPAEPAKSASSASSANSDAPATSASVPATTARSEAGSTLPAIRQPTGAQQPAPQHADRQAAWFGAVRQLMARTEDVGPRFAEEARRIHYGEKPPRGIRGQATPEEREALQDEGIETVAIPVPRGLDGPVQ